MAISPVPYSSGRVHGNLAATGGTATEIALPADADWIVVSALAEWKFVFAASAAAAVTAFTTNTATPHCPSAVLDLPLRGEHANNFYIKATGAALVDGLSYWFLYNNKPQ